MYTKGAYNTSSNLLCLPLKGIEPSWYEIVNHLS